MMPYLGAWSINNVLTFYADTVDPDTGISADASTLPTYRIYKNADTSPLVTGTMAVLDDANTVGWYAGQITLNVANGFAVSQQYVVRIQVTVAGVTAAIHHTWQITA
jgi:hypothetical protein